ncbi:MAG: transcription-repair coupling factor [Prevotellaceae bacterium]|jgi:transcription-repair coupling factor (superfamily II helicase)|nr:transcription-repair coupling factor [Prevotellaceae bacterium]
MTTFVPILERQSLLSAFAGQERCRQLLSEITSGSGNVTLLRGLAGSARQLAIAAAAALDRIHIVILNDSDDAAYCYGDLTNLLPPEQVYFFPSSYKRNIRYGQPDMSNIVQRTAALNAILDSRLPLFIVTYPDAVAEKVASRETVEKNAIRLHRGEKISLVFLRETLSEYGFERADFVAEPGQFAVRGSIIDVFSFSDNRPVRVDFFGDEVESIRTFNIDTQLSEQIMESVEIIANLQETSQVALDRSLFDFAGGRLMVWAEDIQFLTDSLRHANDTQPDAPLIAPDDVLNALNTHDAVCFTPPPEGVKVSGTVSFNTAPQPSFNKNFDLLSADISAHTEQGYTTYILTENPAQKERLRAILASIGKDHVRFEFLPLTLHEGFIDHSLQICCYTDHQLFERYHRVALRRQVEKSDRLTLHELSNLQIGDYVVHIDHGIGVFGGLVRTNVNGKAQEAVKLVYRDNDVLFVSIHGLHRISKYKGKDGEPPKIYKLGTGAWQRLKQTTKSKVKDIARELTALYAQRKEAEGFAFSPDSYLQNELEASFIYEDTPDQLKATQAVKVDMELPHPMDRLVCGDVGFGKTEVAIRAAFKAASDGKQVAVLVPTTILALQHHKTFGERLGDFPVRIDYVSRLKTAKNIKETLIETEEGKIDILIGTHRLLNKDVKFKDLGLLIVDEEQKFGVGAKEKLRAMKLNVDTLTMSATPIPRTLQFSLMGARDLSIINTPPLNRHPIVTEVHTFQENIIRDAINYETNRGGQVFFLHNRVQDIREIEDIIRRICPDVKTCVGHGQMPPEALEKVILDFMHGDYDVLICTTIIENGIDIPNANTIIINHAQNFGLSDLHQLRGRVGRSNRKAFCYLLAPPFISITDEARRRLKAIETFSELGSGFNIAMQDLDIRGAGNVLGSEQSGFISDIGFETYQRILNEALLELRAETPATAYDAMPHEADAAQPEDEKFITDCTIDTDMEILIPDDYIGNVAEKMRLYKELDNLTDETALQPFIAGLTDRFGKPPQQVYELCNIVRLRWKAIELGFEKIVLKNKIMTAYFISNKNSTYYRSHVFAAVLNYIQAHPRQFKVKERNEKLILSIANVTTVEQATGLLKQMEMTKK